MASRRIFFERKEAGCGDLCRTCQRGRRIASLEKCSCAGQVPIRLHGNGNEQPAPPEPPPPPARGHAVVNAANRGALMPSVDDCLDRFYNDLVPAEDVTRMRVKLGERRAKRHYLADFSVGNEKMPPMNRPLWLFKMRLADIRHF